MISKRTFMGCFGQNATQTARRCSQGVEADLSPQKTTQLKIYCWNMLGMLTLPPGKTFVGGASSLELLRTSSSSIITALRSWSSKNASLTG